MNLTLTARHFEITPNLKKHIDTKIARLEHYADRITRGEVVLFRDSINDIAEGKIHVGHTMLTARGQGKDMYLAVNDLVDKLVVQLNRYEGKLRDRKRHNNRNA